MVHQSDNKKIVDIRDISGDSKLLKLTINLNHVDFIIEDYDSSEDYKISFKAEGVKFFNLSDNIEGEFNLCRLELLSLDNLSIEKGYFVPNVQFGLMMKEIRNGFSLVYGKKKGSIKYLLHLIGDLGAKIIFSIKDLPDVMLEG